MAAKQTSGGLRTTESWAGFRSLDLGQSIRRPARENLLRRLPFLAIPAAAALLLWPALWNRYPIVFADTGTYLSQAIHHYAGWDRPVFYSLFMLPLHGTITLWPVVLVQAMLAAWILWLVCRVLLSRVTPLGFIGGAVALTTLTWLPWLVCELMPDLFTPLLILVVCVLACVPQRLSWREHAVLLGLATFMITSQQSSLPLACVLLPTLGLFTSYRSTPHRGSVHRRTTAHASARQNAGHSSWLERRRVHWPLLIIPPAIALFALCSVNLLAHGRFAVSPFGNIFLLARVIYDGPGMDVLRRDCPTGRWRLCPYLDEFPPTSDDFLWRPDSPLNRAGGPKLVSLDADAIIRAALQTEPLAEARAAASNTFEQLQEFASGDGLTPWLTEVSHWIASDFPAAEAASYADARQQSGLLAVPWPLPTLHKIVALAGVAVCALLLPLAFVRRAPCAGFLLAVLIAVPVSAAITGALSTPHDRYQSRIMWLPPFIAIVSLLSLRSPGLSPPR
jgi:hypothetical protein